MIQVTLLYCYQENATRSAVTRPLTSTAADMLRPLSSAALNSQSCGVTRRSTSVANVNRTSSSNRRSQQFWKVLI